MTKLERAAAAHVKGFDWDSGTNFIAGARWALEQMMSKEAVDMAMRAAFEAEHKLLGRKVQMTAALAAVRKEIEG